MANGGKDSKPKGSKPNGKHRKPHAPKEAKGAAKVRSKAQAAPAGKPAANRFLKAAVIPSTAKGVKIPDDNVMPSATTQCVRHIDVVTDSAGVAYYAIAGNFLNSVMRVGHNTSTGNLTLMSEGSPDLAAANSGCTELGHLVPDVTATAMCNIASDVRLVSAEIRVIPTANATSQKGLVCIGRFGRGQWPAAIDDPAMEGFTDGLAFTMNTQGNGFLDLNEVRDACPFQTSASRPATTVLFPQDESSRRYRALPEDPLNPLPISYGLQDDCSQFRYFDFENLDAINETDFYLLPTALTVTPNRMDSDGQYDTTLYSDIDLDVNLSAEQINSWVAVVFVGCEPTTAIATIEIVSNWEFLPRAGFGGIVSTTPSNSNPMQMAQADNELASLPPAYSPSMPDDPNTKKFQQVAARADPGGESTLKTVSGLVKDLAPLAMAML